MGRLPSKREIFGDENPFYPPWPQRLYVALALLTGAGAAQARDVNWSIGVNSPGVSVGVSNGYGYPVYVAPRRCTWRRPIITRHRPPRVYYAPPAVYYAPPPATITVKAIAGIATTATTVTVTGAER